MQDVLNLSYIEVNLTSSVVTLPELLRTCFMGLGICSLSSNSVSLLWNHRLSQMKHQLESKESQLKQQFQEILELKRENSELHER